ncbi:hypothetical protein PG995_016138 [Apiospora arundinis]
MVRLRRNWFPFLFQAKCRLSKNARRSIECPARPKVDVLKTTWDRRSVSCMLLENGAGIQFTYRISLTKLSKVPASADMVHESRRNHWLTTAPEPETEEQKAEREKAERIASARHQYETGRSFEDDDEFFSGKGRNPSRKAYSSGTSPTSRVAEDVSYRRRS